jgi:general secretion pathway protein J
VRRQSTSRPHAGAGVTLIELIVAVALLAVLTLMAYRGLDSVSRAADHTQAESERWRAIAMFFERLGADVAQAASRPVIGGDGKPVPEWLAPPFDPIAAAAGEDRIRAQVEFTRKSPPGGDEVRLGYRLGAGRVELLLWRVLDRAPDSVAEVHPLLDGVKAMRLRHLDRAGAWHETWPPANDRSQPLPRALAVELTLSNDLVLSRIFALP